MAAQAGLILVDTKYEFGRAPDGRVVLIDEVHTPDSSRFWKQSSYADRLAAGQEPENFDKEFVRLAYVAAGLSRRWRSRPRCRSSLWVEASQLYISSLRNADRLRI